MKDFSFLFINIGLISLIFMNCNQNDNTSDSATPTTTPIISDSSSWTTQQIGSSSDDFGYGVSVDSEDNIYVSGYTHGALDGNTFQGKEDMFLVKFNSNGIKQWTRQLGTSAVDCVRKMTMNSEGDIYLQGSTTGGLDGNTHQGLDDISLVNYSSNGIKQWARQLGTPLIDKSYGIAKDSSDNVYLTGHTQGELDGNVNQGDYDIFLVKYNKSGIKQWSQQFGTTSVDESWDLAEDSNDNIYLAGATQGGLDGNINQGGFDIILVKYDNNGTKQWTQQFGSSSDDKAVGLSVDSFNNIYLVGNTAGALDGNTNQGSFDSILVKYDSSGIKQWIRQIGSDNIEVSRSIVVDSDGNIYITGYTLGNLDGNTNQGEEDIFLVKYNSNGDKQWTKLLGTSSTDIGQGITVNSAGNIFVTGYTLGNLDGNTNQGNYDTFLVKYDSNGNRF